MMTKANASPSPSRSRNFFWIAIALLIAAIATHGYLLSHHYNLKFGALTGDSICNLSGTFNCSAVAASRFSELFGVPMALWGLSTNLALLVLLLIHPLAEDAKKPASRRNLLLLSGLVAAASIVMGGISAFILKQGCPFCIVTYILSFLTFASIYLALPAQGATGLPGAGGLKVSDLTPLVIAGIVVFIGSFIANDQLQKAYGFNDLKPMVQNSIQEWQSKGAREINTVEPLVLGASNETAKMKIVEFADFRCVHCQHAAPVMKAFLASHPDVRLEFQVWPLDGECNTAIQRANGASCLLARTVYCAEKVGPGKGWKAHDLVFSERENFGSVEGVRAKLPELASALGIAPDALTACTEAPETKAVIEKQAAVGTSLNLEGTPSIFVNGKQLPGGQSLPVLNEAYRLSTEK